MPALPRRIRTAHIVTPERARSAHHFIHHARNCAIGDPAITAFVHGQLLQAFQEDVDGLDTIEALLGGYAERQPEIWFHANKASLAMRPMLKQRAEREAAA